MCRRKRSRPSSKRRLTKKWKRRSSGRSVCASAIGVVEEHRFSTNGPALSAGTACSAASATAPEAKLGVAVITSPDQEHSPPRPLGTYADSCDGDGGAVVRAVVREDGSPAVIGIH